MLTVLCLAAVALTGCDRIKDRFAGPKTAFDGQAAYTYTRQHLEFGPRVPGTAAHDKAGDWIVAQLRQRTDSVTVQRWTQTTRNGTKLPLMNILARFNPGAKSRVLYLTHWDTRPVADEDLNLGNRASPILGAVDGASGVGMFLALADVFKKTPPSLGVDLLFTDGEDWGDFNPDSSGKVWPDALFGSQYFAAHPPSPDYNPLFGVLWDMVGASDLHLWQEENSVRFAPEVVSRVWRTAQDLGYGQYFKSETMGGITDDQIPLQNRGWHVIDVVDWPFGPMPANASPDTPPTANYHHTLQDTFDKVSAKSLQVAGDVAVTLVK
jgi:glutaminyl-peptide cyclotransferase